MATIEQIIATLPKLLQENPNLLSANNLQALDQILDTLNQRSNILDDMEKWFISLSKAEKDNLKLFAISNRELKNKPAPSENTEAGIRQNLFEACSVRQQQKEEKQSQI